MKKNISSLIILIILFLGLNSCSKKNDKIKEPQKEKIEVKDEDPNRIVNGIHVRTGFKDGEGLMTVVNTCTVCHSAKLVIQNRMNKERWNSTIKWMQETQNLWDLGENQEVIVNYLVKNYPILKKGRRESLNNIEWYDLK